MSKEPQCPNDTIQNMISNLKPSLKRNFSEISTDNEDFATPNKKTKDFVSSRSKLNDISKLNDSYLGSPREMRRLRANVIDARSTILSLEARIQSLHAVRKDLEITFENEKVLLKKQQERDRKSIEELEEQLQSIRKREMSLKAELSEVCIHFFLCKGRAVALCHCCAYVTVRLNFSFYF